MLVDVGLLTDSLAYLLSSLTKQLVVVVNLLQVNLASTVQRMLDFRSII